MRRKAQEGHIQMLNSGPEREALFFPERLEGKRSTVGNCLTQQARDLENRSTVEAETLLRCSRSKEGTQALRNSFSIHSSLGLEKKFLIWLLRKQTYS